MLSHILKQIYKKNQTYTEWWTQITKDKHLDG